MIQPTGSGGWGTTPDSHWTMQRSVAAIGLVAHLGLGFGPAFATTAGGVSLPGVPTAPVTAVPDSVGGVTQATSANRAMTCGSGLVLSGGVCVPLPTPTVVPNCAYGTVWSGGVCMPIGNTTPPPVSCPTGQVLSGSTCVPLPSVPSTCPPTQPANTQYLTCPTGQTGSVVQTRDVTCGAHTGYSWSTSTWSTASNSCTPAPTPVQTPPATPRCSAASGAISWGANCSGFINVLATDVGGTYSINDGGPNRTLSWRCDPGGVWTETAKICESPVVAPPPRPPEPSPPLQCGAVSGPVTWGNRHQCSGYINAGNTPVGHTYSVSDGSRGSISWICGSNGSWAETGKTCTEIDLPPPAPSGCAAQTVTVVDAINTWTYNVCYFPLPSAQNGQVVDGGSIGLANSYMGGTATCSGGNWDTSALTCTHHGYGD